MSEPTEHKNPPLTDLNQQRKDDETERLALVEELILVGAKAMREFIANGGIRTPPRRPIGRPPSAPRI